jgi:hypothetical protein
MTTTLANTFSRRLSAFLSLEEMTAVCAANELEDDPVICHSHDYCDANEIMAAAFKETTGREIDLQSDDDREMWCDAWADAKEAHFKQIPLPLSEIAPSPFYKA